MASSDAEDQARLARDEVAGVSLGDRRLDARFAKLMGVFAQHPDRSIPSANPNWASTKATYRFFDNRRVTPEQLLAPHIERSIERCRDHETILVIGDSTYLDFSSRKEMDGVGPLGAARSGSHGLGLVLHTTLLASESGIPLGVGDNMTWARDPKEHGKRAERCKNLPIEQKESRKWLRSMQVGDRVHQQLDGRKKVVCVFDREGDIYSVFHAGTRDYSTDLLVRAVHNRNTKTEDGQKKLWDSLKDHELGQMTITIPRRKKSDEREAMLAIRCREIEIQTPPKRPRNDDRQGPIKLTAIWAHEITPGRKSGLINWKLLTTLPVESFEDAQRVLRMYSKRWLVEIFFRTLKSGCKIEDRQFESAERLLNCLAADSIVAWTVMYLTRIGREQPDLPCDEVFTESEWKSGWLYVKKTPPPSKPPTLREMILIVGRLGGHLGRKGDGMPGTQTLWRGLCRLSDLAAMWTAMHEA